MNALSIPSWPQPIHFALDNGLPVAFTPLPHLSLTSIVLFVRVGSRFETPADSGLSHLLEHVLFRGSQRYPDTYTLNTALESVGSGLDAATSRDFTTFEATCLPDKVSELLAILGDMIIRPTLDGVDVEQRIITEELQDEIDQKGRDIDPDNLSKMTMFAGSSMALKVGGVLARIQRFTVEDCRRWHRRFYTANNMALAISGPITAEQAKSAAQQAFGELPAGDGSGEVPPPIAVRANLPAVEHVKHAASQTEIHLAWILPAEDHADFPALSLIHRLLDDGTCARLRHRLVDQLGLAYHAAADLETYDGHSVLTVTTQTQTQTKKPKVFELVESIFEVVGDFMNAPVGENELERAMRRLALELSSVRDSPGATSYWNGLLRLYPRIDGLDSRMRRVLAVTPEDLMQVARRHLDADHCQLTVVGELFPLESSQMRRLLRGLGLAATARERGQTLH
jgi:predicted Zn-dependent peptidase